jgi:Fur family transcriptional regulator, stress-responsive regulator
MAAGTPDLADVLRRAGLRATAPRLLALAALTDGPSHLSAEAIIMAVRTHLRGSAVQTIYNVLNRLTDAGILRRIEPAGSPALYELRVGDNHHHAVCRRCDAIADIDCVVGAAPCLEPSQTDGFLIDEAEVTFWGICSRCRAGGGVEHSGGMAASE